MSDGDGVNVIVASGKRTIGFKTMEKVEQAFTSRIQEKIAEVKSDVDSQAVERMAWDILGQKELYDRKKRLEKELADVQSKMADFDGGRCSSNTYGSYNYYGGHNKSRTQIEDARVAAFETQYPEIKKLEKLLKDVIYKTTMCAFPTEFKEVADWLEKELAKIFP
jgi:hypothetical protein